MSDIVESQILKLTIQHDLSPEDAQCLHTAICAHRGMMCCELLLQSTADEAIDHQDRNERKREGFQQAYQNAVGNMSDRAREILESQLTEELTQLTVRSSM